MFKPPFRKEVPIKEFEKFESVKKDLETLNSMIEEPGDRVIAAQLAMELFLPEKDTPPEAKPMIVKHIYDNFIGENGEIYNKETAKVLIDLIRIEEKKELKIRYLAILSHDLQLQQEKYYPKDLTREKIIEIANKSKAFQAIAKDGNLPRSHRKWAQYILNPFPQLQFYTQLYDKDPDVEIPPKIREEITKISDQLTEEERQKWQKWKEGEGLVFTGKIMRLNPYRLPTWKKIEQYEKLTGRPLPVYIVRKENPHFVSVPFPVDLSNRLIGAVTDFRAGKISRDDVFTEASMLEDEFVKRMNPEQQKEFLGNNVEVRFGTEKSERL